MTLGNMKLEEMRANTYSLNTDRLALGTIEVICAPCQFLKVHVRTAQSQNVV